MNCQFCRQAMEPFHSTGQASIGHKTFRCTHHAPLALTYKLFQNKLDQIIFIFYHDTRPMTYHHIMLLQKTKKTILFYFGENFTQQSKDSQIVLHLNHLIDINPNNAQAWLDKLLKLKTFS